MFRYSIDEFIASKQKEKTLVLLEELLKHYLLEHCPEIESLFDKHVRSYEFLEDLAQLVKGQNERLILVCVPWDSFAYRAEMDLKTAYDKLNKSWRDTVPFIEFSFPDDYKNKHGRDFQHVYIFFFTKYSGLEGARDCSLYYLNKLNNLKAFL